MIGLQKYVRDPSLPARAGDIQLCAPLDKELVRLVRETLVRAGGPNPEAASLEYTRWKPGNSITACYRVRFSGAPDRLVTYKRYAGDKASSIAETGRRLERGTDSELGLRNWAALPARGICLWVFPVDRLMVGLQLLLDKRWTARLMNDLGIIEPRRIRRRASELRLLRYKPERRAVFQLDLSLRGGPTEEVHRLAARVLPREEAERVRVTRQLCFGTQGGSTPALIGAQGTHGMLFEEWLNIETPEPDCFEHAFEAGSLLAELHLRPVPPVSDGCVVEDLSRDLISGLRPLFDVDPELHASACALRTFTIQGPRRWIHGDFHPNQVALDREQGGRRLMDLDSLRLGRPQWDLSSWIADALACRSELDLEQAAQPLLEGYRTAGGPALEVADLSRWVAVELVRRAAGVLRRLEIDAVARARALLDRASSLSTCGSHQG